MWISEPRPLTFGCISPQQLQLGVRVNGGEPEISKIARVGDGDEDADGPLPDYSRAMAILPKDPNNYFHRGNSYYDLGLYDKALADYNHALLVDPHNSKAYNSRGRSYLALGSHAEAFANFQAAIRLDPNCAEAYNNCGVIYYKYGDFSEALQAFTTADRLGDTNAGRNAASLRQALGLQ
jgi:tetratricopeptide (TPR) repeat protein